MRRRLVVLNFALTLLIAAVLLIAPFYDQSSSRSDGLTKATLLQVNGPVRTLRALGVPLALSAAPMFSVRMTRISGILMLVFAILGGGSIGLLYLPGAVLLLIAGGAK